MSRFYIMMSDFYVHEDENTASTMVDNFAEQLDELYDSGEANNKIVPIFIVQGGGEGMPEYSLEPLYFTVINGVPLIFSTAFRLYGRSLDTIDSDDKDIKKPDKFIQFFSKVINWFKNLFRSLKKYTPQK